MNFKFIAIIDYTSEKKFRIYIRMIEVKIPCCYFPTTVAIVDDDKLVLKGLFLKLGAKYPCISYSSPIQALDFLTKEYQPNPFMQRVILRPDENENEHRVLDIDVRAIHQEIYNPQRFTEISVLIVDYAMPSLTGAELCQQLRHLPVKKIMLTGEATHDLAVRLFNEKLIDNFFRKDADNFLELILAAVKAQQVRYFQDLSELVVSSLTKDPHRPPACLDDPVFIDFFNKLCQEKNIVEYYLADASGSFLLLDSQGHINWLIIKTEAEMEGWTETARDTDAGGMIVQSMETREKVLFLLSDEDFNKPASQWIANLHPAKPLQGRTLYHYAIIKDSPAYPLGKILSYQDYLNHLD